MKKLCLIILISLLFFLPSIEAAVSHLVRYQGYLTDSSGTALNGSYNLTFRIYNAVIAGTLLWNEAQAGIQVSNGNFSVLLGGVNPLNLSFDSDCWISIQVNSDGEMTPRQRITSVPTAYRAENAEKVNGITVSRTPQANTILPLDATGKIPNSVLKTGSGNGLDADTVDGIPGQEIVRTTGDQTIAGAKTFSSIPTLPASDPTSDNQPSRKAYVDGKIWDHGSQITGLGDNDHPQYARGKSNNIKIDSGSGVLCSATEVAVSFNFNFVSAPDVVVGWGESAPGSDSDYITAISVSTTGFTAHTRNVGLGSKRFNWIAVGSAN